MYIYIYILRFFVSWEHIDTVKKSSTYLIPPGTMDDDDDDVMINECIECGWMDGWSDISSSLLLLFLMLFLWGGFLCSIELTGLRES